MHLRCSKKIAYVQRWAVRKFADLQTYQGWQFADLRFTGPIFLRYADLLFADLILPLSPFCWPICFRTWVTLIFCIFLRFQHEDTEYEEDEVSGRLSAVLPVQTPHQVP